MRKVINRSFSQFEHFVPIDSSVSSVSLSVGYLMRNVDHLKFTDDTLNEHKLVGEFPGLSISGLLLAIEQLSMIFNRCDFQPFESLTTSGFTCLYVDPLAIHRVESTRDEPVDGRGPKTFSPSVFKNFNFESISIREFGRKKRWSTSSVK